MGTSKYDTAININGKLYTFSEVTAIHKFYQACLERGQADQALAWALDDLSKGSPEDAAIARFVRARYDEAYNECVKRIPAWKAEREDFLKEAEWAWKDLATVAAKEFYAQEAPK